MQGYLVIGEVAKPQGVKGQIKVKAITKDLDRFLDLSAVYLEGTNGLELKKVTCQRVAEGFAYLTMAGIETPEAVDLLRGKLLYVDRQSAVALSEDENFIVDLVGCKVVDEEGTAYGTVSEVIEAPANDVYIVRGAKGEILIPALKAVVTKVDVANKLMHVVRARLAEVAVFPDEDGDKA